MNYIKKIVLKNRILTKVAYAIKKRANAGEVELINNGIATIKKEVLGKNHKIIIGKDAVLRGSFIRITGESNTIIFEDGVRVGPDCSFWLEGRNVKMIIRKNTSFTRLCHINAQEDNSIIEIGEDCMFSNNITVRTSDSHPIYDLEINKRINYAKNIRIGNHVWICPNTKIMKGATIEDGCVIGSDSMVSGHIDANCLAVGHPARIVKQNINWTREDLF